MLLQERYTTLNTIFNKLANQFVFDWLATVDDYAKKYKFLYDAQLRNELPEVVKNTKTQYENLFWYFYICFKSKYKIFKQFTKKYKVNGQVLKIQLKLTSKISDQILGDTVSYFENKKEPHVIISIPKNYLMRFVKNVLDDEPLNFDSMKMFISQIKGTIAHEATHYFQLKRKEFDPFKNYDRHNAMWGEYTKPFSFFLYFIQKVEMDAVINEGYKLYRSNDTNKSFFDCLVYVLTDKFNRTDSKDYFKEEISFRELIYTSAPLTKFLLLWSLYVYIPENSKFRALLAMSDDEEKNVAMLFSAKAIQVNAKNVTRFIRTVQKEETDAILNGYLKKLGVQGRVELLGQIFNLKKSNKSVLTDLLAKLREY